MSNPAVTTIAVSFEKAVALAKQNCSLVPTAACNENGKDALLNWIEANAKKPDSHVIGAWMAESEAEAVNMLSGYDGSIEMRGMYTRTGNPVTLRLDPSWFDWRLYFDGPVYLEDAVDAGIVIPGSMPCPTGWKKVQFDAYDINPFHVWAAPDCPDMQDGRNV